MSFLAKKKKEKKINHFWQSVVAILEDVSLKWAFLYAKILIERLPCFIILNTWYLLIYAIRRLIILIMSLGETGANWHPGWPGTPRVSAHLAVAMAMVCLCCTYTNQNTKSSWWPNPSLFTNIITNHFWPKWITWVYNSYFSNRTVTSGGGLFVS